VGRTAGAGEPLPGQVQGEDRTGGARSDTADGTSETDDQMVGFQAGQCPTTLAFGQAVEVESLELITSGEAELTQGRKDHAVTL
jgi:hypothetical protein